MSFNSYFKVLLVDSGETYLTDDFNDAVLAYVAGDKVDEVFELRFLLGSREHTLTLKRAW